MLQIIFITLAVLSVPALTVLSCRLFSKGHSAKLSLTVNFIALAAVFALCFAMPLGVSAAENSEMPAQADAVEQESQKSSDGLALGLGLIAAALVTGISGIGGGLAVAAAAPAAIGANAENPKTFGKSMAFVALGEGIALFGLVIAILILGKI